MVPAFRGSGVPVRILLAALTGYAVVVLLVMAGTFTAMSVTGLAADARPTTVYLFLNIAASFLAAIGGGYVTARCTPAGKIAMSVALLVFVFLGMAVLSYRLMPDAHQPPAYLPLVTLLGVIGIWTGTMTERAIHGRARSDT